MTDDRTLIPQIPSTVDERRAVIEARLRTRYPDLDIRVDLAGDVYSIVASCSVGSFTEEASVYDSSTHTLNRLRPYFVDLANDYSEHLDRVAADQTPITPEERGARLDAARTRARLLVTHAGPSIMVRVDDLSALLDAADILRDGATAAEEAEHEASIERSIAEHESSLPTD